MARIDHECALDVLREKVKKMKTEWEKYSGTDYTPHEREIKEKIIKSLEHSIFVLELEQEPMTFR